MTHNFGSTINNAIGVAVDWLKQDARPRLALDGAGKLLWANAAARNGLVSPLPLVLRDDRLEAEALADVAALRAFLDGLDHRHQQLVIACGMEGAVLVIRGYVPSPGEGEVRLLDISLPRPIARTKENGFAQYFRLTPAEAAIVDGLVRLETPVDIAEGQGVSVHTVRTHIRRIYAKVGIRSNGELLQLAMAFAGH